MKLKKDSTAAVAEETDIQPDHEKELGYLVMECLGVLLVGNANNAAVFRESGGARCAHNLIPFTDCRRAALCTSIESIIICQVSWNNNAVIIVRSCPTAHIEHRRRRRYGYRSWITSVSAPNRYFT